MEGGRCFVDYLKERKWSKFYPSGAMKKLEYPEITLDSLLKATVEKYGNRTAIISENEQMSYLELENKVDRLAGAWDGMGLKKGERIEIGRASCREGVGAAGGGGRDSEKGAGG